MSEQVRRKEQHYTRMGISAVLTFVFNERYTVSGAQDANVLSNVIRDILNQPG
ncbi:MAG: hypothetical protein ACR2P1_21930 [Pseudomonadales bacterium]